MFNFKTFLWEDPGLPTNLGGIPLPPDSLVVRLPPPPKPPIYGQACSRRCWHQTCSPIVCGVYEHTNRRACFARLVGPGKLKLQHGHAWQSVVTTNMFVSMLAGQLQQVVFCYCLQSSVGTLYNHLLCLLLVLPIVTCN